MSQSISRRSFLKCAGSGAVSLAAALLTGVPAAAQQPRLAGEPALLDGKAAVELLGYAPAQEMGNVLVYLSVENLSASTLPVGASYLQSREVCTLGDLYSMGTGVTAVCDGRPVRCGSSAGSTGTLGVSSTVPTEEALLPWSPKVPERFRLLSTAETSLPLVRQSGVLLQPSSQVKALRPTSSASTARRL